MKRYAILDKNKIVIKTGTTTGRLPAKAVLVAPGQELDKIIGYVHVGKGVFEEPLSVVQQRRIDEVKRQARASIEALSWRLERAREREQIGATGETVADVLAEREAIRCASNRVEAEIAAALDSTTVKNIQFSVTAADRAKARPARITRMQFVQRFTDQEMQGIIAAAKSNPSLEAFLLQWQAADGVLLTDPTTVAGVQALEAAGLIATGRAQQILSIV